MPDPRITLNIHADDATLVQARDFTGPGDHRPFVSVELAPGVLIIISDPRVALALASAGLDGAEILRDAAAGPSQARQTGAYDGAHSRPRKQYADPALQVAYDDARATVEKGVPST